MVPLVASRDEADLVVEVLNQSEGRDASSATCHAPTTRIPPIVMTNFLDVDKGFTLETKLFVPKGDPIPMNVYSEGRRPRDVAKTFAQRLEGFCRMNYSPGTEKAKDPGTTGS